MDIRVTFTASSALPFYAQEDADEHLQNACVQLDLRSGEVDAFVVGSNTNLSRRPLTSSMFRRYSICNSLTNDQATEVIQGIQPLLQRVFDGSELQHDGQNWVFLLNADAQAAEAELQHTTLGADLPCRVITNLTDWLSEAGDDCWVPADHEDIEAYIRTFDLGGMIAIEDVREVLTDMWAERLYNGDPLPPTAAQYLIRDGRCADSEWTQELAAFAAGANPTFRTFT